MLTPELDYIDIGATFDNSSGGAFEADKNSGLLEDAFHTENIFFPPGSPFGEYVFFVDSANIKGIAAEWRLEVVADGEEPMVQTGSRFSSFFSFFLLECSIDEECDPNESCISNSCVYDGSPRMTVTWEGHDDLDIFVITPNGDKISWENGFDEISLGELQDDPNMFGKDHVESVIFYATTAPEGDYTVGVNSFFQDEEPDSWDLVISVDGQVRQSWSNRVGNQNFTWTYTGGNVRTLIPSSEGPFPENPSPAPTGGFCISGETTVLTEDRGEILMKDLQLGDKVATSDSSFEPVYSFGHRKESVEATYLSISPSKLEITSNHMIFIDGRHAVPASSLEVGDRLANGDVVTAIQQVQRTGVYAPFTPSGKLLVNGVLVSSYVAFQNSEYLKIPTGDGAAMQTPVTFQWLAHTFEAPHRFWCTYVCKCLHEEYTNLGVSTWVNGPHELAHRWLQSPYQQQDADFSSRMVTLIFSVLTALALMAILAVLAVLDACVTYSYHVTVAVVMARSMLRAKKEQA